MSFNSGLSSTAASNSSLSSAIHSQLDTMHEIRMSAYSPTDLLLQSIRDNMNYFPVQQAPIYLYPHLAAWYNNHWPVQSEIRLQWNHTSEDHCYLLQPGQIVSSVRISICYNVRLLFCATSNMQESTMK